MDISDDKKIVELLFLRNEDALKQVDAKYRSLCLTISGNILSDEGDIEECFSDTLMKLWESIPPAKPKNLKAYISKIIRNLSLNRLEHDNAKKRSRELEQSIEELDKILPDDRIDPGVLDEDIGRAIDRFLDTLKERDRNIFIRKYWYLDKTEDIAERYSVTENHVNSILYRTRTKLHDYLIKEGIYL